MFIALGGNVGDVRATARRAIALLAERGVLTVRRSSAYRTVAHTVRGADPTAPAYWNAVIEAQTKLTPQACLEALLEVERLCGRERTGRWAPRTLDLDLLLYGEHVIDDPGLVVPHPHLAGRAFVLAPLAELAPTLSIPGHAATARALYEAIPPQQRGILDIAKW